MTAEQLEELLGKVAEGGVDGFYAKDAIRDNALSLARRVLAAEKLVAELELILENDEDHWCMFKCALTAYREASK